MIVIESKRKRVENILKAYPSAVIADVTSQSTNGLVKFSPFYPHCNIPVPFSPGLFSCSVEGIWQGLKVFQYSDIDTSSFTNNSMTGIKRTVRRFGKILGHRKGVNGAELLSYIDARYQIYLPSYKWVLENKLSDLVLRLKDASKGKTIVLLDYTTNCDIDNPAKPLSHAYLIKAFVENLYPFNNSVEPHKQLNLFD